MNTPYRREVTSKALEAIKGGLRTVWAEQRLGIKATAEVLRSDPAHLLVIAAHDHPAMPRLYYLDWDDCGIERRVLIAREIIRGEEDERR